MFSINYDKILENKEMPALIKDLAREIQKRGGIHVGEWLKSLSTADVWYLTKSYEEFQKKIISMRTTGIKSNEITEASSNVMIVLADVLSCAENIDTESIRDIPERIELLSNYLGAELLVRKGEKINIKYENLTLDLVEVSRNNPIEMSDIAEYVSRKMNLDEAHREVLVSMSEMTKPNAEVSDEKIRSVYERLLEVYDPNNNASVLLKQNYEAMMEDLGISYSPKGVPNVDAEVKNFYESPDGSRASMVLAYDPEKDGPLEEFINKNVDQLAKHMGGDSGMVRTRIVRGGQVISDKIKEVSVNSGDIQPKNETAPTQPAAKQEDSVGTDRSTESVRPKEDKGFVRSLIDFIRDYKKSTRGSSAKS